MNIYILNNDTKVFKAALEDNLSANTSTVLKFFNGKLIGHVPIIRYLLTPWSRVLLEKLTGSAASQEIPRIFGTRRFITVLTSARHLSLS